MPKFNVERLVDAYAVYSAEVEAKTPDEAMNIARTDETVDWGEPSIREFDNRDYEVFDENGESKLCTI